MKNRIEWVCENTRLLGALTEDFRQSRPFAGKTIGTGIHLEPKTVSLLLTLQSGGARVVSTGNLNTTQQEAVEYLKASGLTVIGDATRDLNEHQGFLAAVLAEKPDILLDNGGDLFDSAPSLSWIDGGHRRDDLRAHAAQALARRAADADPRHQRQPDQAVRRERTRCRTERAGILYPDHQSRHERPARNGVRLRRLRARGRGQLQERPRKGERRRSRSAETIAGASRRLRYAASQCCDRLGRPHHHGHRGLRHPGSGRPAALQGRRNPRQCGAFSNRDRSGGYSCKRKRHRTEPLLRWNRNSPPSR